MLISCQLGWPDEHREEYLVISFPQPTEHFRLFAGFRFLFVMRYVYVCSCGGSPCIDVDDRTVF